MDTVEQSGGYNFSLKGKNKKIPACQTRCTTLHYLVKINCRLNKVKVFHLSWQNVVPLTKLMVDFKHCLSCFCADKLSRLQKYKILVNDYRKNIHLTDSI